jgi:hypothetical protein
MDSIPQVTNFRLCLPLTSKCVKRAEPCRTKWKKNQKNRIDLDEEGFAAPKKPFFNRSAPLPLRLNWEFFPP